MKNKKINLLVSVILLFAFSSCKKYLDEKTSNGIATPTSLYDLQSLLDNSSKNNLAVTPSQSQSTCDDYFIKDLTLASLSTISQNTYRWIPTDYYYGGQNDWSKSYLVIYNSNLCLETIKSIERTSTNSSDWDNVKGSALFYRSYFFMQLCWEYAKAFDPSTANSDLGIVLRTQSDFNVPSVRSSVKESYEQIISDAKESIQYLPNIPQHVVRPSKTSAYGLLARTYLTMQEYDSAFKYATLALTLKNDLLNYAHDLNISGTANPFTQKYNNKEIIFYTEMNNTIAVHSASRALIDSFLYASYSSEDIRKNAFFTPSNGYYKFRGNYTASNSFFFTGITTSEIILIQAECAARLGHKDDALASLNTLMINRWNDNGTWVPITSNDAAGALAKILIERRKELIFRGLRWIDIKRLNKEGANIIPTRLLEPSYILYNQMQISTLYRYQLIL